jgi:4,4'-diaponeurosporenoate glycosyltransferase
LFLDADTRFEPNGLAAILHRFSMQPTVLSVLPFHDVRKLYECMSAFFQLIMAAGSRAFTFPPLRPAGLFGQMLLIDRDLYFRIGGHEAVKAEILENFHLAALLRRRNVPLTCAAGRGSLAMRMYPHGIRELVEGWSKAFAAGAAKTPPAILPLIIGWLSGFVMTAAAVIEYPGWYSALIYGFAALQLFILLRRLGSFPLYVALLFPLPLAAFFLLFARASTRRRVTWKGRTIDASA